MSAAPTDLLVVGAGAKATALAAKVHALNTLGAGPLTLTIVEANEIAASWLGRNGMTSGEEPLAIPPIKDIGFPYRSAATFGALGEALDRAMLPYTWQRYMIDKGEYARWVNAGSPAVQHRDYGRYLAWALAQATAGVSIVRGRVTRVELPERGERWRVRVADSSGECEHECAALVLTGPGVHRALPHDPAVSERIFHCDSRRGELTRIPAERDCEIAIVGGGESALSALAFLRDFRPRARITVYTPTLPLSRGESFLENRVFADPDAVAWSALDRETRRDFVKHCDRGVFDPGTLASIAYDDRCRFATGRVTHVGAHADCNGDGGGVCVAYAAAEGPTAAVHDY
ncbi:MAG TPA: SidA/IucD/PvdA family monooxygenase, partial [Solirubrobacteraceae bacterium]|nr:SidA/IucD/PvdA family monooxygenase [Solirubrobacteraceae bacterium]